MNMSTSFLNLPVKWNFVSGFFISVLLCCVYIALHAPLSKQDQVSLRATKVVTFIFELVCDSDEVLTTNNPFKKLLCCSRCRLEYQHLGPVSLMKDYIQLDGLL